MHRSLANGQMSRYLLSQQYVSRVAHLALAQPVAVTRLSDAPSNPKFESSANNLAAPPPMTVLDHFTNRLPFGLGRGRARTMTAVTPASPEVPLPTLAYGASPAAGHRNLEHTQSSKMTKATHSGDDNSVQVAVLIAMPDPSKPRYTPGISPVESHADSETTGTKGVQNSLNCNRQLELNERPSRQATIFPAAICLG
jgi:hypothetical protein